MLPTSLLLASLLAQAPSGAARVSLVFGGDVIPRAVEPIASLRAKGGEDGNSEGWDHLLKKRPSVGSTSARFQ